jgi:hypothetical protein
LPYSLNIAQPTVPQDSPNGWHSPGAYVLADDGLDRHPVRGRHLSSSSREVRSELAGVELEGVHAGVHAWAVVRVTGHADTQQHRVHALGGPEHAIDAAGGRPRRRDGRERQ